jgi:hypothetical protein
MSRINRSDIVYTAMQHFFVREMRPENTVIDIRTEIPTIHPFCCISIGYFKDKTFPFRVVAMMVPRTVAMVKDFARIRIAGLHQSNPAHNHTNWYPKEKMLSFTVKRLLRDLNFDMIQHNHPNADWETADKSYYNVVLDLQGLRFNEKMDIVPRSPRRDDAEEARIEQSIHKSFHEERSAKFNSETFDSPVR